MALTAKQRSRKLREEAERRGRERDMAVPLQRQIAHKICEELHVLGCVCSRTLDRPVCDRMESVARWIIDTVRTHDARLGTERGEPT